MNPDGPPPIHEQRQAGEGIMTRPVSEAPLRLDPRGIELVVGEVWA